MKHFYDNPFLILYTLYIGDNYMNYKLILPSAIILVLSGCSAYQDHSENPYMDNDKAMDE